MARVEKSEEFVKQQLESMRERLAGDVGEGELRKMQLQIDVLAQWARLAADEYHNHDHMDDHDHSLQALPTLATRPELRG